MSVKLSTKRVEKPWGMDRLPAPFASGDDSRIGEIWFEPTGKTEGLLAKYLFTSEKLSVQVHPSDETSPTGRGKDECWLVLHAEPDARLAIGFNEAISSDRMRAAAEDGSIEDLLEWHAVKAGDFVYLPSGTVHAIGAGLTLVEIQQNTDITYRLFDYGRPRELHLDEGIAVAKTGPHPESCWKTLDKSRTQMLVDGPKFRLAHMAADDVAELPTNFGEALLVLPLEQEALVKGAAVAPSEAAECDTLADIALAPGGRCLVASIVT